MDKLNIFFAVMTILGLMGSFLVYRHDRKNKRVHRMIEIIDIVRVLGGKDKLLIEIEKKSEMDQLIRDGIPSEAWRHFQEKMKLSNTELNFFIGVKRLPKKNAVARLSPIESDRLFRLARLYAITVKVLDDESSAAEWLKRPQWGLGGITPLEMAITEIGAKEVENLLGRIEFSVLQ